MVMIYTVSPMIYSPIFSTLGIVVTKLQLGIALLVQFLGFVIGVFSSRYLEGESGQKKYIKNLSGLLGSVSLLLLANHWIVFIIAWGSIGMFLEPLLCFYSDRPFALLAAHKKFMADRVADLLLIVAAGLAWQEVGSGSLTDLGNYLNNHDITPMLHISALLLVVAVIIRTALLPVHGWLIQVMEAPTPVSAILHAGVINLGGFVLIRFSELLNEAYFARWVLLIMGLLTAFFAGLVMLTRVSIKVRLAWSTVAQMGFMILECGLGLYSLAVMHLIGHSLYKAHTFLGASGVVEKFKIAQMKQPYQKLGMSLIAAPFISVAIIILVQHYFANQSWPFWWSVVLGLAWSPMLWTASHRLKQTIIHIGFGFFTIIGLALLATFLQVIDFDTHDINHKLGLVIVTVVMLLMYILLALIQRCPEKLTLFQRWSYAGLYLDEIYTRLTLKIWPVDWVMLEKKAVQQKM